MSEKLVRLEAAKQGIVLWRNNVGAVRTADGRFIRFGLANDSKRMNQYIKSSDLIGIRPVLIGPEHIGKTVGQFVAFEVKPQEWQYSGKEHEQAQKRFLELVSVKGGYATFMTTI